MKLLFLKKKKKEANGSGHSWVYNVLPEGNRGKNQKSHNFNLVICGVKIFDPLLDLLLNATALIGLWILPNNWLFKRLIEVLSRTLHCPDIHSFIILYKSYTTIKQYFGCIPDLIILLPSEQITQKTLLTIKPPLTKFISS